MICDLNCERCPHSFGEDCRPVAPFDDAVRAAFFGTMHKLNAAHLAKMQTPPQAVSSEARQLLCILRDQTQSRAIYDRCVAIVGDT